MTPANNMDEARELLKRALEWLQGTIGASKVRADIDAFLKNDLEEAPSNSGDEPCSRVVQREGQAEEASASVSNVTGTTASVTNSPVAQSCLLASTSLKEEQREEPPVTPQTNKYEAQAPNEESKVPTPQSSQRDSESRSSLSEDVRGSDGMWTPDAQSGNVKPPPHSLPTEIVTPPASTESKSLKSGEEIRMRQDCRSLYEFLLWNLCRTEPYPIIDFKLRAEKVIDDDGDSKRVLVRFYIHADGVDSQTPVFTLEEPSYYGMCRDYQISDLIHFGSWYQKAMEVPHFPASTSLKEEEREVMPNVHAQRSGISDRNADTQAGLHVTRPSKSEPLAMRACPECEGTGHMSGDGTKGPPHGICPTCKGTGQVRIKAISDPAINELDAYRFPTAELLVKAAHEIRATELGADRIREIAKLAAGNSSGEPTINERLILNLCEDLLKIPIAPPASPESKSLEDIFWENWAGHFSIRKQQAAPAIKAVASSVSLRYKGEIEKLGRQRASLLNCVNRQGRELEEKRKQIDQCSEEIASLDAGILHKDAEISRLTTLCNENAVLAVEAKAEIARLKAIIEEAKDHFDHQRDCKLLQNRPDDICDCGLEQFLARLAQKGKS